MMMIISVLLRIIIPNENGCNNTDYNNDYDRISDYENLNDKSIISIHDNYDS